MILRSTLSVGALEAQQALSIGGVPKVDLQRQFPASAADWAAKFPTLPTPLAIWTFQESASPIDDKVGANDLVANGGATGLSYAQSGDTEPTLAPRSSLAFTVAASTEFVGCSDTTYGDCPAGGTRFLLVRFMSPDNGATNRSVAGKGDVISGGDRWGIRIQATTGLIRLAIGTATAAFTLDSSSAYDDGAYHDVAFGIDPNGASAALGRLVTETEDLNGSFNGTLDTSYNTIGIAPAASLRAGACIASNPTAGLKVSYMALFDAVFTAAHMTTFRTAQ